DMIYGDAENWQGGGPARAQRAAVTRVGQPGGGEPVAVIRRVRRDIEVARHDHGPGEYGASLREHGELIVALFGTALQRRCAEVGAEQRERARGSLDARFDRLHGTQ